tara:strand:- start:31 stop:519 length:489 start_codon:yes stop_codon:yes gene_type:complete
LPNTNAPVQTSSLNWAGSGAVAANFNFTSVTTATPAAAGSQTTIATYQVPYGTSLRFDGGRGMQFVINSALGVPVTTGFLILCVVRQDGSRKVINRTPLNAFDTAANQKNVNMQQSYQSTVYAYGGLGEEVQVIIDDGGVAFNGLLADTMIDLPYNYRITGR